MRIPALAALAAVLAGAGCATYSIETTELTLAPGGYVHVHGQGLRVKAVSRGPGELTVTMLDGAGKELGTAGFGTGRWDGGGARTTDVWIRNDSPDVVSLDVWAGGDKTVAVSSLEEPLEGR